MTRLKVFVPVQDELRRRIWRGSGIVGSLVGDTERLRLDFEGDDGRYPTLEERIQRAAERHLWIGPEGQRYPTSAMAYVNPEGVLQVGWWDVDLRELELMRHEAIEAWLRGEAIRPTN